jgi:MSHA biogenesis protein MshE
LYAALQELNTPQRKIITVEDPVEYRVPGLNQVQVQEKIDLSFGRILRAVLRQDPDVILVGEMRDHGTVETGLRAAMTGHMVFSTLHTNDAASTPIRLLDMGAQPYLVAMSLHLVLAQRLVRVICQDCKTEHPLTPQEREWLFQEIADQVDRFKLMRGRGCERCSGTGYRGRTGIYEMLEMTKELVHATTAADPSAFIAAAKEQMQGHTLRRHAAQLALRGRTSVEEAMSVSAQIEV